MGDVIRFGDPQVDEAREELADIEEEVGTEGDEKAIARKSDTNVRAAMVMAMNGSSYADIARVLDYATPAQARLAVEKAISESGGDLAADRTTLRGLTSARLEYWLRSISTKIVTDGPQQLEYMAMGLRLTERRAKLLGLDMPTTIELHSAGADEVTALVTDLVHKLGVTPEPEGDPFAEVDDLVEGEDGVWRRRDETE